jgi:hypothetical protein
MAGPYAHSNNSRTSSGISARRYKLPSGIPIAAGAGAAAVTVRKIAWIILFSSVPATLCYAYLHYSETGAFPSLSKNAGGMLAGATIGSLLGAALYRVNKWMDRRLPWRNNFSLRFLAGYTTDVFLSLALSIPLAVLLVNFFGASVFWQGLSLSHPDLRWKIIILLVVVMFLYNVIYALRYAYQHYAFAQLDHLRTERKQLELQFEALKGQISPHYLFNSLNTISSLLFKDLQSAEQFVRRLAQTYQYILATQNKKWVLLREELEFVQSYYYLLRIRFQQQLNVEINVPLSLMDSRIPPLTLQMLVENAVKHNPLSDDEKLFIYISAQDNTYLKIANTRTGAGAEIDSFKVGLENIRKRYRYFTDKQILVKNDGRFMISLPVIHPVADNAEHKHSA